MFTGIIQTIAKIESYKKTSDSLFLTISKPKDWKIKPGDSIASDGVCLTVKKIVGKRYLTELMRETLDKTTFGKNIPNQVNLEPSLKLSDLLGGHMVLGHVDTMGRVESIEPKGDSKVYKFNFPEKFRKLIANKGSITVDGVSLTVVDSGKNWFTVSLVDYTIKHTTLGAKRTGQYVNLEFDVLAKYLDQLTRHK